MILLADDTNIFLSGRNLNEICSSMNIELNTLSRWFKLNKLSLNIKRPISLYLDLKLKKLPDIPNIQIDNVKVDMVETCKFLGIMINSYLDWSDHINLINRKV